MKILISNTGGLAIYEQIIRQIKDAIIAKAAVHPLAGA